MVTHRGSTGSKHPLTRRDYEAIMGAFPGVFQTVDEFMEFVALEQDKADRPDVYERKPERPVRRNKPRSLVW